MLSGTFANRNDFICFSPCFLLENYWTEDCGFLHRRAGLSVVIDQKIFFAALAEVGEEVHLQRAGELGRSAEGEVDVLAQHLGDVGARHLHALGEVGLGEPQLLHAQEDLAQECRADMVDCSHRGQGSGVRGQCVGVRSQESGVSA